METKTKYLIIGNSTAAVGAVEGLRKVDRETPIVLLSKESHHTYSRPLISYLLAGEIDDARMLYRPADFYGRNGVEARLGVEVSRVDADARVVEEREAAIRTYAALVGSFPDHPHLDAALYTLALLLEEMNQRARARHVYHRLLRDHPTSRHVPHAYLAFADFYFADGQLAAGN